MDYSNQNHQQIQSLLGRSNNLLRPPQLGQQNLYGSIGSISYAGVQSGNQGSYNQINPIVNQQLSLPSLRFNSQMNPVASPQLQAFAQSQVAIQPQQILVQPSIRAVQQPNNAEVHHFERPLQVVTMDDMESKWKTKCMQLEVYLYDLQAENLRLKQGLGGQQISYVQDDTRINELSVANKDLRNQEQSLRQANKQLQDELDQWKLRYKQLQESNSKNSGSDEEIRQLKKKISRNNNQSIDSLGDDLSKAQQENSFKDQEILKLKSLMNDKDNELDQLDARIRELEMQCESYSSSEQQITTLQGEVELWKRKFKQQNELNSDISEKLTMAETQLEAIKKSKVTVTKETEVKKSGVQGSGTTTSYESSTIKGATLAPGGYASYGTTVAGQSNTSGRNSVVRNSGYGDRKQL